MARLCACLLLLALESAVKLAVKPLIWLGRVVHRAWTANKVGAKLFPKWAERRKAKGEIVFKGKLTYATLGGLVVALAASVLGDGVLTQADLDELGQAALALVAIYGRWRATRA